MSVKRPRDIAVVIPAYNPDEKLLAVIDGIDQKIRVVIVVDDGSTAKKSKHILGAIHDKRVTLVRHRKNQGVGAAMKTGYSQALSLGAVVVVKIDADGQMDPSIISSFVNPVIEGAADYAKGNRFHSLKSLQSMPKVRVFGNSILTILSKTSSGYWAISDPTNGYTAVSSRVLNLLDLNKLENRYFFESDMLFQLNLLDARVVDVPMSAKYLDEHSNLSVSKAIFEFPIKLGRNLIKRLFLIYFIRDFSLASLQLLLGVGLTVFGFSYGLFHYIDSASKNVATPTGTLILIAISLLAGLQFILAFMNFDIQRSTNFKPISSD